MTVTIGSQTDVPAPGDPIVSPWHQDTSRKLVHVFSSTTTRDGWVSPPTGAVCQAPAGTWWNYYSGAWHRFGGAVVAFRRTAPNRTGLALGTFTELTGTDVTFTADASHNYRVNWFTTFVPNTSGQWWASEIRGGPIVAGYAQVSGNSSGTINFGLISVGQVIVGPVASLPFTTGSVTIKIYTSMSGGSPYSVIGQTEISVTDLGT